ncbi:PREDICTED: uncharacterized protein LOC108377509 [Rhagoletis zephyria]|uniref:uncharacterized protein LOC108362895 n=1 Tax=Rhagoletis zephyria TaxID=28612 RepID=UPI0008115622|nr:PREDICTED: uncharacterized protein LOC108362895 [Rhagoletis zephyria]XP_017489264.1 PREDICTED: uncharacterized protein LOC108377509 [Rhagoletis zephyria]
MILISTLIGNWEKLTVSSHANLAVLMFLFMVCAFEVVLLKLTTIGSSTANGFGRSNTEDDDSSEYEEDIYYEDLRNNYERWARRQMRYRHRVQRQEQEMLRRFREQEQQRQRNQGGIC